MDLLQILSALALVAWGAYWLAGKYDASKEIEAMKNPIVQDKCMEGLRDRTIKIDIPYMLKWDNNSSCST